MMNPIKIWSAVLNQNSSTLIFVFTSLILLTATVWFILKFESSLIGFFIALGVELFFGVILYLFFTYSIGLHLWVFLLPSILIGVLLFTLISYEANDDEEDADEIDPFVIEYTADNGKEVIECNLKRGAIIYGSAGAGKTFTGFFPVFKWQAERKISGVVYDHKDFELTEFFLWYNKTYGGLPVNVFCPDQPDLSVSINPIAPRYLTKQASIRVMSICLMQNLASDTKSSNAQYFVNAAAGLFAGIVWRTKKENPDKCTLPHIASYLFQNTTEEFKAYLDEDIESKILASTFLEGLENERLAASIKGSVADAVSKLCTPELFAILEKDEVDLGLNKLENPTNLILVNQPGYAKAYNPILSLIFECAKIQMSVRGRNPSCMTLDEAGMIWLNELYNIPALLRSFDIATFFGIQDMVQGQILYDLKEFKALQANLSTKLLGKANDPDTAAFYEKMFEFEFEDQESVSKKKGSSFMDTKQDTRVTTSQREVRKTRAHEFMKLKQGEFFIFDENGEDHFAKWDLLEFGKLKPPVKNVWSNTELQQNFNRILEEGKDLSAPKITTTNNQSIEDNNEPSFL